MTGVRDGYPFDMPPEASAAAVAQAWRRELPGVSAGSIEIITPLWQVAKLLADERMRTLRRLRVEPATLDLLSTLRRAGDPYTLTTRQIAERTFVTAGAVSQRVARAEDAGLVTRSKSTASRRAVAVTLTPAGHELIESTVRELLEHEETLVAVLTRQQRTDLATALGDLVNGLRQVTLTRPDS
ncbi:MarR family winged helix-turn-helix transcriptional regulator [Kibdelosporangium phytohabitans]|nr:MarR family transcriptional regulator [Kibdelosporangium phytohabitans]MBE1464218.1 DNA-binding MarR family transcriptional regulator [Kibdelosporangium phytohabitans]